MSILRVSSVRHLGEHRLHVEFNDGFDGEVDLADDLEGPIFRPLRDVVYFSKVGLQGGAVSWPNGADMAPEYLARKLGRTIDSSERATARR